MRHWNYCTKTNRNLLHNSVSGMLVVEVSLTLCFINISVSGIASRMLSSSVSSAIRFLFSELTCFIVENVLSHTHCVSKH